jgi:CRISPR-associated protein Cmr6
MKSTRPGGGGKRGGLPDWSELALPLPKTTAQAILSVGRRPGDADNVGLWLDKLVHRTRSDWTLMGEHRGFSLRQLCRPWQSAAGEAARARFAETVRVLHPRAEQRRCLRAEIKGRLLMDHGRAAASETSASFHPIWGVPRLPGSALKGVTRAEVAAGDALASTIVELFGGETSAGRVVFYEALPIGGKFELALDVLTPHHHDYYAETAKKKSAPADWDSPLPFTFVTVVKTSFEIWLGARSSTRADVDALGPAADALTQALESSGIGAKTAAGYGRFKVTNG